MFPLPYGPIPTANQLQWQEMEMYCIIHFGLNTYTDKEWGFGDVDPSALRVDYFDANQIVVAAKSAGCKGIVVVAKHHDGFCLWPTKTTPYNISKSPYRSGKGDILNDYRLACDKNGMQMGVYCSPWDRNIASYGNKEYVQIYRAQLKELYTRYGKLFISWHDGANGGDGYYGGARDKRTIDKTNYYQWDSIWATTRKYQPGAVIFGDIGPDIRWVGNEDGVAGDPCWASYSPLAPDSGKVAANGYSKYWMATEGTKKGLYWMPPECDVPLRPGWFYHTSQDEQVKTTTTLLDLYYKSVGRGAALDIGLAPGPYGKLHPNDVDALRSFGNIIKQTFAKNLLSGAAFHASNVRMKNNNLFSPKNLVDNNRYTYWATDDSVLHPWLEAQLRVTTAFNVIRLRENIKLGQRIAGAEIDVWEDNNWKNIAVVSSIGANRLVRLPGLVSANKIRIRITDAAASICLSDWGLFKEPLVIDKVSKRPTQNDTLSMNDFWKTRYSDSSILIDMGEIKSISGITYRPLDLKSKKGLISHYVLTISTDGINWAHGAKGEFANIASNPIKQSIKLFQTHKVRYIKLFALELIDGDKVSNAEIKVVK